MKKMYEHPHLLLYETEASVLTTSPTDTVIGDGSILDGKDFI